MSSSVHVDNKKKDILILGEGPTQGLENTLTKEKCIQLILLRLEIKFTLNLHYDGVNSYLFVHSIEIYKFKAKDSEIVASSFCLGNISKE